MTNYRDKYRARPPQKLSDVAEVKRRNIFFDQGGENILQNISIDDVAPLDVESDRYIQAYIKQKTRYIPEMDYNDPSTFAFYGSAEKYYEDSVTRIHDTYPYDGSSSERLEWFLSSSYLVLTSFISGKLILTIELSL